MERLGRQMGANEGTWAVRPAIHTSNPLVFDRSSEREGKDRECDKRDARYRWSL